MGWLPALAPLAVLALLGMGAAQLVEPGVCPFGTPLPQSDWSEERFSADPWYEVQAFALRGVHDDVPSPVCTTWHFSPSEDGRGLHAHLKFLSGDKDGGLVAFAQYSSKAKDPLFNLTIHRSGQPPLSVDVKLIATDYTDFALLWGCSEPNLFERKVASWVLSRRPVLSKAARETVKRLCRRYVISAEKFVQTDHESCLGPGPGSQALENFSDISGIHEDGRRSSLFAVPDRPSSGAQSADAPESLFVGEVVSPDFLFLGALLAFAAVSLLVSMFMFSALLQRRAAAKAPVLPLRRQDIARAGAGGGGGAVAVDYSRFGGLGQGLVQTRKSGSASLPRLHT